MAQKSELENTGIDSVKLIETSTAWDGLALPNYPTATPVISIYKYTFPPHPTQASVMVNWSRASTGNVGPCSKFCTERRVYLT